MIPVGIILASESLLTETNGRAFLDDGHHQGRGHAPGRPRARGLARKSRWLGRAHDRHTRRRPAALQERPVRPLQIQRGAADPSSEPRGGALRRGRRATGPRAAPWRAPRAELVPPLARLGALEPHARWLPLRGGRDRGGRQGGTGAGPAAAVAARMARRHCHLVPQGNRGRALSEGNGPRPIRARSVRRHARLPSRAPPPPGSQGRGTGAPRLSGIAPMNLQLQATRVAMRALERTAPSLGAALAERLFFTPPRTSLTPPVREVLATGRPFRVCVEDGRVAAWAWGHGPAVALVHGWGGRGGRLAAAFVAPLVASGFSVITFDAPGHGASDGRLSSMPQVARALQAVADAAGSLFGIVAHSMGGSASALAMTQGLQVERAVFLAPAADPARFAEAFARLLAVGPAALAAMRQRSEARLRFRWSDLNVPRLAAKLTTPLLVVHDR